MVDGPGVLYFFRQNHELKRTLKSVVDILNIVFRT